MLLLALLLLPITVKADYAVRQTFSSSTCAAGTETGPRAFTPGACQAAGVQSARIDCSSRTMVYYSGNACAGAPSHTLPLPSACSGRGASYTGYTCVASPLALPDTRTMGAVYATALFASCPASGAPTAADLSSALEVGAGFPAGCTAVPGGSGYTSAQVLCGPWGAGSTVYADAACRTPVGFSQLLTPVNFTCAQSSAGAVVYVCLDPVAAAAAVPAATCRGAALPAPLATPSLSCYDGVVSSTGDNTLTQVSGYSICVTASAKCSAAAVAGIPYCKSNPTAHVRIYTGFANASSFTLQSSAYVTDISACTTPLCNALATDACPIASITCKGAALPAPLATPTLSCYNGLMSSLGANSGALSNSSYGICAAFTSKCASAAAAGLAYCKSNPTATVRVSLGFANSTDFLSMVSSPGVSDISACTTALCNLPSADTCPFNTCKGAVLPAPLAAPSLTCFDGVVSSTGDNTLAQFSGYSICAAASAKCSDAAVSGAAYCQSNPAASIRFYLGFTNASNFSLQYMANVTDISACTTPLCNALASDTCPITSITCKGAALPAPLATPTLSCYNGLVSSLGVNTVAPSSNSSYGICTIATIKCASATASGLAYCQSNPTATVRVYLGLANASDLSSMASSPGASDVSACTTALCNSPSLDACPINTCKGTALPTPLATPTLSCYNGLVSSLGANTVALSNSSNGICAAFTSKCASAAAAGLAYCQSNPTATVRVSLGFTNSTDFLSMVSSPGVSDVSGCTTALCNAPSFDTCPINTCKGAVLPAPLSTLSLTCFNGIVSSTGDNTLMQVSGYSICVAASAKCSDAAVSGAAYCQSNPAASIRFYLGYANASDFTLQYKPNVTDISACTTPLCNALATETCPIPSITCKGATLPAPLATPTLSCFIWYASSLGVNTVGVSSSSSFGICAAFTLKCASAATAWEPYCQSNPTATVRVSRGFLNSTDFLTMVSSPGVSAVSACTKAACNSPAADSCPVSTVTCKGAALPASLATPSLTCYVGVVTGTGSSITSLTPSSGFGVCGAATATCSHPVAAGLPFCQGTPTATVRFYFGLGAAADLSPYLSTGATDFFACTTALCNAPSSDSCAVASAPAYTPLSCAARGALSAAVSAAPIACYSNLATGGVGAPVLQAAAVPGAAFCVATTVNCAGASAPRLKAACGSSKATLRVYSDNATLQLYMEGPMLSGLYPPAAEYHQYFGELLLCSTAGCNAPAADACALAPAPVPAYASFSGLPASAQDAATGKLSASGLAAVQAAVSAGVAASACSTCIATVTRATDASSGAVVYGAARRRLALNVKVTFDLTGASATKLAEAATAASSPTFFSAAAGSLALEPGYASVTVAAGAAPEATATSAPAPTATSAAAQGAAPAPAVFSTALLAVAIGVPAGVLALVVLGVLAALRGAELTRARKAWAASAPPQQPATPQSLYLRRAAAAV